MYSKILKNGIFVQNPASAQLLGLCPLLAVTNSAVNALGLGLSTIFILMISNALTSIFRKHIPNQIRIPVFVLIISSSVTVLILLLQAFFIDLYKSLGIYVSLIVTNCIIIGRAEVFATKNKLTHSVTDGFAMGVGISIILLVLGILREIFAQGTIFFGLEKIFGDCLIDFYITLIPTKNHLLIAGLPAGAFIFFGILLAFINWLNKIADQRKLATNSSSGKVTQL